MLDRARVREVFAEAAALPDADRAAYLDRACAGDAALRNEVASLLDAAARHAGFMRSPTTGGAGGAGSSPGPGAWIGPYRLLELIGEGGFGAVYLAEQETPVRRRVALKIIKLGMDTRAVIARFEAERQALALMDHPNIARVYDAGATDDGLPYFVMELVPGEPITDYCDRVNLGISERIELFTQVCHAVQDAHAKGVIHRDIKPSNVLVAARDGRPHAKVIDFGIAKFVDQRLGEKRRFTEFHQLVGTPEYMSPEQAQGSADIDTRADVYGLGVLLYELLTGSTPFDARELRSAAYAEIQRIIREVDPPKPSTRLSSSASIDDVAARRGVEPARLSARVRGDLDWIVMKAVEKERARRYETPSALAADLARHLAGQPVEAAPPSSGYRLRKFARRNRGLVIAGSGIAGALVLGVLGTSVGLALAVAARAKEQSLRVSAEYESYIANIESASSALLLNDATRLRTRLDACPPERRNWEWRYLDAASDTSLIAMHHPRRNVQRAAYSPDALRIASTSGDGKLRLWDATTFKELHAITGPERFWHDVAFSSDGAWLVAPARDGRVWIWDARTLRETAMLPAHKSTVTRAFFLGVGTRFATASHDGTARVWEAPSGRELAVFRGHEGPIHDAASNRTGSHVVTASDESVRVWTTADGVERFSLSHAGPVTNVAWSADDSRIATASEDGFARVWDAETGREAARFDHGSRVYAVAFSPDGTRVVSAGADGTPRVWDAATGALIATLRGHSNTVWGVLFDRAGARILSNSADNTVRLWDAATGAELSCLRGHVETPWTAMFTPDGTRILTGGDQTLRLWPADGSGGWSMPRPLPDSDSICWSPDERSVVECGVDRTRRIDIATGRERTVFDRTDFEEMPAVFSPDGTRVLRAFMDHSIEAWDLATERTVATMRGHEAWVWSIGFRPDGARLVTASDDRTARVWDSNGAELLNLRGHDKGLHWAAYDPAGTRIATASRDGTARIHDAESGDLLCALPPHGAEVNFVCFSPDGRRVLSAAYDYTARVWDADSGELLTTLRGHEHVIVGAMYSPDSTRIVTASRDGTARLWDAATGRQVLSIRAESGGMNTACFSRDGTRLLLASDLGLAWLLDSVPVRERFGR